MIAQFLTDLDRSLRGSGPYRRRLLREAADGLADTVEAYREAGLDEDAARRRALADFGDVARLVPAFQAEIDIAAARRTALAVTLATPPLVSLWNLLWDISPEGGRTPPTVLAVILLTAAAVGALGFLGAVGVLATTGRLGARRSLLPAVRSMRVCARMLAGALALALSMVPVGGPRLITWPPTTILIVLTATIAVALALRSGTHIEDGQFGSGSRRCVHSRV